MMISAKWSALVPTASLLTVGLFPWKRKGATTRTQSDRTGRRRMAALASLQLLLVLFFQSHLSAHGSH